METIQTIAGISILPIIIGLTELAKRLGLPARFAPLISLALGIGLATLAAGGFTAVALVGGVFLGLSASGLWSGVKSVGGK